MMETNNVGSNMPRCVVTTKKKNGGRTHPAEHGHFVAEATAVGDALVPPVQHEPAR